MVGWDCVRAVLAPSEIFSASLFNEPPFGKPKNCSEGLGERTRTRTHSRRNSAEVWNAQGKKPRFSAARAPGNPRWTSLDKVYVPPAARNPGRDLYEILDGYPNERLPSGYLRRNVLICCSHFGQNLLFSFWTYERTVLLEGTKVPRTRYLRNK